MNRWAIHLQSQFFTGTAIGANSFGAGAVIYAGTGQSNASVRNRMNLGHFEGPGATVKTDEERSLVVICYEKGPVGLAVAIEIGGD